MVVLVLDKGRKNLAFARKSPNFIHYTNNHCLQKKKKPILLLSLALLLGACTATVVEDIPLPEHPRPDFERAQWVNLNGYWDFGFQKDSLNQKILVPFPWGSPLSEVENKGDIAWYSRTVTIPKSWKGKRVFLVVGASDWKTEAWLDGKELGSHEGGYTPFEFELKDVKAGGSYPLVLKVDDTYSDAHLYGKQGYGNARGIWQTVYLEARGTNYIQSLHFLPNIDNSNVTVEVKLAQPAAEGEQFKLAFKTGGQETFTALKVAGIILTITGVIIVQIVKDKQIQL